MAHKNVSFFIPKTMMTTGEKMKENSHPILTFFLSELFDAWKPANVANSARRVRQHETTL